MKRGVESSNVGIVAQNIAGEIWAKNRRERGNRVSAVAAAR